MDALLVMNAAGDLVPANEVGPNGGNVAPLPALLLDVPVAGAEDGDQGNPEEWKVVRSRKFGWVRGAFRGLEDLPDEEVKVCELEFEWYPKIGSVRAARKWSQMRKGGFIETKEGPAILTYGCSAPSSL